MKHRYVAESEGLNNLRGWEEMSVFRPVREAEADAADLVKDDFWLEFTYTACVSSIPEHLVRLIGISECRRRGVPERYSNLYDARHA